MHLTITYPVYTKTCGFSRPAVSYRLSGHYEAILTGVCSCRTCTPSGSLYCTAMHRWWFGAPVNWNL